MKLAVNARFLAQATCGPQRFAGNICRELKKLLPETRFLAPPQIHNRKLADELEVKIIGERSFKRRRKLGLPAGILWEQIELPGWLKKNSQPPLFNPANQAPLAYSNNFIVIHDIAFRLYPEFFTWRFALYYNLTVPRLARRARHIFTVSRFSKETLSAHLHLDEEKISLVSNAVDENFRMPIEDRDPDAGMPKTDTPFILAAGSLEPRKNLSRLVTAFQELGRRNLRLLIAGGGNQKIFRQVPELAAAPETIVFTGPLEDRQLARLYRRAEAFVYPSLFEGFGLPPLEAQACGCPVLVAEAGALPEIFSGNALFCDPDDPADIAAGITRLLDDQQLRTQLVTAGLENAARFSWAAGARIVIETVNRLPGPTP